MEPRAVAASSSISVFNRLMTHSIASRPWHRNTGLKEEKQSRAESHTFSKRPHLTGINRYGISHETLEVAAQTDTFYTDQSFLRQHRPGNTERTNTGHLQSAYSINILHLILNSEIKHINYFYNNKNSNSMHAYRTAYFSGFCGCGLYVNFSSTDTRLVNESWIKTNNKCYFFPPLKHKKTIEYKNHIVGLVIALSRAKIV